MRKDNLKIAVAGCGGLGSHLLHLLFDFGVNRNQFPFVSSSITAFDSDVVDLSNLLHQAYTSDDLGKKKAEVMAERYLITPELRYMTVKDFKDFDLVFSCVDNLEFRSDLYQSYWNDGKPGYWIDGRCSSHQIGVFNCEHNRELLETMIRNIPGKKIKSAGCLREVDKVNKISHATPIIVASIMMQQFLNYYREEKNSQPIQMLI